MNFCPKNHLFFNHFWALGHIFERFCAFFELLTCFLNRHNPLSAPATHCQPSWGPTAHFWASPTISSTHILFSTPYTPFRVFFHMFLTIKCLFLRVRNFYQPSSNTWMCSLTSTLVFGTYYPPTTHVRIFSTIYSFFIIFELFLTFLDSFWVILYILTHFQSLSKLSAHFRDLPPIFAYFRLFSSHFQLNLLSLIIFNHSYFHLFFFILNHFEPFSLIFGYIQPFLTASPCSSVHIPISLPYPGFLIALSPCIFESYSHFLPCLGFDSPSPCIFPFPSPVWVLIALLRVYSHFPPLSGF